MTTLLNVLNAGPLAGKAYMTQYDKLKAQMTGIGCTLPAPPAGRDQEPVVVADKDADGIADANDACPDAKGVADVDPKKNGCPVVAATTPPAGTNLALTDPVAPSAPSVTNSGRVTPPAGSGTAAGAARPAAAGAGAYGAVVPQPAYQPAYVTPNLGGAAPQQPVYTYGNQIGGDTGPGALAYLVIPGLANIAWFARKRKQKAENKK